MGGDFVLIFELNNFDCPWVFHVRYDLNISTTLIKLHIIIPFLSANVTI